MRSPNCSSDKSGGFRSCDQSCISPIGSYRLSLCCESTAEERSAADLHATFWGSREWATAAGNPVEQEPGPSQTGLRWRGESQVEYPPGDYSYCACSRLYSPFHQQPLDNSCLETVCDHPTRGTSSVLPLLRLRKAASRISWFCRPSSPGTRNSALPSTAAANSSTCRA
jgi:hypothetical protein